MDSFKIHGQVIADYRGYIESFINIRDEGILAVVQKALAEGRLWPEPLIQFNPSYKITGDLASVVASEKLQPLLADIFKGYRLYQHQMEALRLGEAGSDFVVTSGTGSGKSLTYIGTIFDRLLKNPQPGKVSAVIVYPMNALINSQSDEIERYKEGFEKNTGKQFPISFGKYTGQEDETERQRLQDSPPDILLTNYMMLELILTRIRERGLRDTIYDGLRYLVFDELHMYRGRQGADVAMLMEKSPLRVLVATDCLSEGINLQKWFTAVLHYDLPWNPNRLEQREGRVDRFGQTAPVVKTGLIYGKDNPIDGIVLDVILRKIREIRKSIGITIPFPEDSKSVIDTIAQALLLNPDRKIQVTGPINHPEFNFEEFDEAKQARLKISHKLAEAEKREVASRSIFAQHAIKAHEIEADLKEVDESIGDPKAVRDFVLAGLEVVGAQIVADKMGFKLHTANLPPALRSLLPEESIVQISFESPTPDGYNYFGRNHPFVEQLCQIILANSVARRSPRAARASVIRTNQVVTKTTVLLFRCRNVIAEKKGTNKIVAEEMLMWGYRGSPSQKDFLTRDEAKVLVDEVRASSELSTEARSSFLHNELTLLPTLKDEFDKVAEERSKHLVEAHERFSQFMDQKQFQVVYPVLPMDVLGIYVLLPGRTP